MAKLLLTFMLLINGFNIYSPDLVKQNNQLVMYFGGWMSQSELPYDGIYRSVCPTHNTCNAPVKVISMPQGALQQVNDPTLVQTPAGYWIMYMTGSTSLDIELSAQGIYFATSWDGVIWSSPQLLIQGYWLPSAVLKDGRVYLYVNPTVAPNKQWVFDLGTSGVSVGTPTQITHLQPYNYANVDVVYHPSINLWQMVGENLQPEISATFIDYLYSFDGINWQLGQSRIIETTTGQVRTPALHPDTAYYVYFGKSPVTSGLDNQIYFYDWSP